VHEEERAQAPGHVVHGLHHARRAAQDAQGLGRHAEGLAA
jgi:hypothetical protein